MARGYPDYFGQSTFNFKGTLTREVDVFAVVAGDTAIAGVLSGKGEIFGGQIVIVGAADIGPLIAVSIYADGALVSSGGIPGMILSGDTVESCIGQRLILWDRSIFRIVIALVRGVTFGVDYSVRVTNGDAVNIIGFVNFLWHRVI